MRKRTAKNYDLAFVLALAAGYFSIATARAEPALDRVLSGVQVANGKNCTLLNIGFNLRVSYISHFPAGKGQELRIMLRPIDGQQAAAEILTRRESVRAPEIKRAAVRAIDFEAGNAAGPVLVVQFEKPVHFQVGQGGDFQSLVIAISGANPSPSCKAVFPSRGPVGGWTTTVARNGAHREAVAHAVSQSGRDEILRDCGAFENPKIIVALAGRGGVDGRVDAVVVESVRIRGA